MTLAQFQSSLAELISLPERLHAVRMLGSDALDASDLDERERRRLVALARDPRLDIAVMLHERRRLAGVLTALPHTSRLLGDAVISSLMREYRKSYPLRSTHFAEEGVAFADFLGARNELTAFAADVLAFETAVLELELEQEREHDAALQSVPASALARPRLAPRSRLIETMHDPEQLATVLRGGEAPQVPTRLACALFLQRTIDGGLRVEVLEPYLAFVLRLCTGKETVGSLCATHGLSDDDFAALNDAEYVIFAPPVEPAA